MQATHSLSSALFCTQHTVHSHDPTGFLASSSNLRLGDNVRPRSGGITGLSGFVVGSSKGSFAPVPGFGDPQATHFDDSCLFCTKHVSQSHVPGATLNLSPNPNVHFKGDVFLEGVVVAKVVDFVTSLACSFTVLQATHLLSEALFSSKQQSQYHIPKACLLLCPNVKSFGLETELLAGVPVCRELVDWKPIGRMTFYVKNKKTNKISIVNI